MAGRRKSVENGEGGAAHDLSTRERIIRETTTLFAQRGYHGTGVSDITKATDLTRGALYYHIASKEALLYEICTTQINRIIPRAEAIVVEGETVDERLRRLARALVANISEHSEEWAVFFAEFRSLTDENRAEIVAARDRYEACWVALLQEGQRQGEFVDLPPIVVKGILGMFNYTYLWFRASGEMSAEAIADLFLRVILDGVRA